jgi:coenzyme F420-reducing hydrogenase delta subunit
VRSRFGIAAPRVAVRTHLPWRWRILALLVVVAGVFVLGGGVLDTGRRLAGFERSESQAEIETLKGRAGELGVEVERLRSIANAAENSQKIDRTAIDELTRQAKALEAENARLKESLAVFEGLATNVGTTESLSLTRLRVEPMSEPGHYRYRMLASWRGSDAKREFKGTLSFQITTRQASGRSAVIIMPGEKERNLGRFAVSFKSFSSLEGKLELPGDAKIERIEARLTQDGLVKASHSILL